MSAAVSALQAPWRLAHRVEPGQRVAVRYLDPTAARRAALDGPTQGLIWDATPDADAPQGAMTGTYRGTVPMFLSHLVPGIVTYGWVRP